MNGVIAATLARNDFIGSTEAVEGKHGLLVGYSDNPHPDKAVAGLGKIYETMKIGVKPYPSCRYTHAALDAMHRDATRAQSDAGPDQARRDRPAPQRHHADRRCRRPSGIRSRSSAASSRCSSPARSRSTRASSAGTITSRLGDKAVDALADKFDVVQDDRLEVGRTHPFGARVSITTDDGVHERLYADPSGEPGTFPDAARRCSRNSSRWPVRS